MRRTQHTTRHRVAIAILSTLFCVLGPAEVLSLTEPDEQTEAESVAADETPSEPVSAADQASWRSLTAKAEHFTALFPGTPEFRSETQHTAAGTVKQKGYRARFGGGFFSVELHELPKIAELFAPAKLVLDSAKNQILKKSGSEPLSFERVETDGHPGSVFSYRSNKSEFEIEEVRLILVGKRLFKLTAGLVPGSSDRSAMDRFFGSFRFLK